MIIDGSLPVFIETDGRVYQRVGSVNILNDCGLMIGELTLDENHLDVIRGILEGDSNMVCKTKNKKPKK